MSDGIITGQYPPKLELGYIIIKQISKRCQAKFTQHLSSTDVCEKCVILKRCLLISCCFWLFETSDFAGARSSFGQILYY